VKWINQISILLLSLIFLLSASGIIVYQSHCTCTGDEHVSVYVSPETCQDNFHIHHTHEKDREEVPSSGSECHECTLHKNECGCNDVNISYYKIKNEVVSQKVRPVILQPVKAIIPEQFISTGICDELSETDFQYIEPPSIKTSLDFLIQIQQLKIPETA
jgi:hypothetical protein